jgi:hypothetical protein
MYTHKIFEKKKIKKVLVIIFIHNKNKQNKYINKKKIVLVSNIKVQQNAI